MGVLEHALLQVDPARMEAFEAAFATALPLIAASPGFLELDLHRAVDGDGTYLLLVRWRSVADHETGFRGSDRYCTWRELLHGFYPSLPSVTYFGEPVAHA